MHSKQARVKIAWFSIASQACKMAPTFLWIETEKPNVAQIAGMVNRIRQVVPNAKLVYNNSPSFNWTLAFREQVYQEWQDAGKDLSAYPDVGHQC